MDLSQRLPSGVGGKMEVVLFLFLGIKIVK